MTVPFQYAVVGADKDGPIFSSRAVMDAVATDLSHGNYCERRIRKDMSTDYERAAAVAKELQRMFDTASEHMIKSVQRLTDSSKGASTSLRKTGNELHESMQRLEKLANLDRLERQVAMLERAAAALEKLAELERGGHLSKITAALK